MRFYHFLIDFCFLIENKTVWPCYECCVQCACQQGRDYTMLHWISISHRVQTSEGALGLPLMHLIFTNKKIKHTARHIVQTIRDWDLKTVSGKHDQKSHHALLRRSQLRLKPANLIPCFCFMNQHPVELIWNKKRRNNQEHYLIVWSLFSCDHKYVVETSCATCSAGQNLECRNQSFLTEALKRLVITQLRNKTRFDLCLWFYATGRPFVYARYDATDGQHFTVTAQ